MLAYGCADESEFASARGNCVAPESATVRIVFQAGGVCVNIECLLLALVQVVEV